MDAARVLTSPAGATTRPTRDEKEQKEIAEATQAKLAAANSGSAYAAGSAIVSIQQKDAVQASADVMRLTGEALKNSAAGTNLAVSGSVLTSLNKASQGDTFGAASYASAALDKISPALSKSTLGAIASAFVLTSSNEKLAETKASLKASARVALSPGAGASRRTKAWLDLSSAAYQVAYFLRSAGNAIVKLGQFGLGKLTKVASMAHFAKGTQATLASVATSPLGKAFGFLNKWIPILNIAGVAISGKNAVDVFRDKRSSTTSKALSLGSVGLALGSLVAGVSLGFLPFLGIVAASVLTDIGLAEARDRDRTTADTDRQVGDRLDHPLRGARDLAGWIGGVGAHLGGLAIDNVKSGFARLKKHFSPAAPAQDRVLVR